MVIGLDCAAPELVFDRWLEDLPSIRSIVVNGSYGEMESSVPAITVPAWISMMTGRDPGELGLYGFHDRSGYGYDEMRFATSNLVKHDTVWDILGNYGRKSLLIGVPPGFPPRPLNGCMVGCFLTPGTDCRYTYPSTLAAEIENVAGRYILDIEDFRTSDRDQLVVQINEMTEKRFRVADYLLSNKPWDFFMMVEIGIDRIQHAFWQYFDQDHVKFVPGSKYRNAIHDYYQFVDEKIGVLLRHADANTLVLVVSDHGAKRMDGGICINEWLKRQGYLQLQSEPDGIARLDEVGVDWGKTLAWGSGGYCGRLFLNVRGREPQGIIPPEDYERVRDRLSAELEAITDENGNDIGTRVYKPEDIYTECNNIPPDLIVYFGDLYWRCIGSLGHGGIYVYENDTGPDGANHSRYGIFACATGDMLLQCRQGNPESGQGKYLQGLNLLGVAPSILAYMGIPIPPGMRRGCMQDL